MTIRSRLLIIPLALGAGWIVSRFFGAEAMSVQVASFILGGLTVLSLIGIIYGIFSARIAERRRRTKEDIWLNH